MILQSLVRCYDSLAAQGKLERPGWSVVKVQWGLYLTADGQVESVEMLGTANEKGKLIPRTMFLPTPAKRTSGHKAASFCVTTPNTCSALLMSHTVVQARIPSKMLKFVSAQAPRSIMRCWTAYSARWRRRFSASSTLGNPNRQCNFLPCRII